MSRYVALIRGINVGGKNLIKMAALKACFEDQGFQDVVTYIQSGNALFTSSAAGRTELSRQIEDALESTFGYRPVVVLRTRKQMQQIVERAPRGFGGDAAKFRYDVIFLKEPLTASAALKRVQSVLTNPDVDRAYSGVGVLYFSRLVSKAAQSRLSRIVSLPIYGSITIRNWATTTKLLELAQGSLSTSL